MTVKKVTITPDMLPQQTVQNFDEGLVALSDSSISIYNGYVRRLIEGKTMFIQIYRCDAGRFRETDFVVTCWNMTETGGYLTCSCRIYRTILDLSDSTDPMRVLDNNGATCMHCRFAKENVLPNTNCQQNETLSAMQLLIQSSLEYRDKTIIELSSRQKTKKFSPETYCFLPLLLIFVNRSKTILKFPFFL